MSRIGSSVTAAPRRFARYSSRNRIPAALLLFGLAVGLWSARRGRFPTARQAAGFLVSAVVIVLLASVMPELVVAFLGAALIGLAIDESGTIERLADRLFAMLPGTTPNTTTPLPGAASGAGVRIQ